MIPPHWQMSNWGIMSDRAPTDKTLKGKCLCGCHSKLEVRPAATKRSAWCQPCHEERNQPWTAWVESIV